MQGKMLVLTPSGEFAVATMTGAPDLALLQEAVGGPIQLIPGLETMEDVGRCVAFCHEEGKLEGLPHNPSADILWAKALQRAGGGVLEDALFGTVVILTGDAEFMDAL